MSACSFIHSIQVFYERFMQSLCFFLSIVYYIETYMTLYCVLWTRGHVQASITFPSLQLFLAFICSSVLCVALVIIIIMAVVVATVAVFIIRATSANRLNVYCYVYIHRDMQHIAILSFGILHILCLSVYEYLYRKGLQKLTSQTTVLYSICTLSRRRPIVPI